MPGLTSQPGIAHPLSSNLQARSNSVPALIAANRARGSLNAASRPLNSTLSFPRWKGSPVEQSGIRAVYEERSFYA